MSTEPNADRFREHSFWLQLALLAAGIGILWLSQRSATWYADGSTHSAVLQTGALILVSLAAVIRSTYVMVTSALSDAYRVFRSRHLLVVAAVLLGTAIVVTASVVLGDPFVEFFAHGHITSGAVAGVGSGAIAVIAGVGALAGLLGAWEALREEKHWYRSLHLHHRRRI